MKRRSLLLGGLAVTAPLLTAAPAGAAPAVAAPASTAGEPLTNLAHLDFLRQEVTPPEQPGHTTYRLADTPAIGVLWTYAEPGRLSAALATDRCRHQPRRRPPTAARPDLSGTVMWRGASAQPGRSRAGSTANCTWAASRDRDPSPTGAALVTP